MMKHLAENLNVGDKVYNCFMESLAINNIRVNFRGQYDLVFDTVDKNGKIHRYSYENIYLSDLEGESDEEKSWIDWAKNNKDFVEDFDHITTIKNIYKQGFANGFVHRQKYSYEEMIQK